MGEEMTVARLRRGANWTACRRLCFRFGVVALLAVALASSAQAAEGAKGFDKVKAAAGMAQQASAAFESGDYARSADLYLSAYQSDANVLYLYGAGRAEQLAGRQDAALGHLRTFLDAPDNTDAERKQRAQSLIDQILRAQADKRVAEGEAAEKAGDLKLAAQLWLEVARTVPSRVDLLYRAAVAYNQAGDLNAARAQLDAYLQKAPSDAPDRPQAMLRREAILRKMHGETAPPVKSTPVVPDRPKAVEPAGGSNPVMAPTLVKAGPAAVEPRSNMAGWSLLIGGAALGVGGLGVYLATMGDISAYDRDIKPGASGKVAAISYATAQDRASSIQTRETIAWALGGVGIVGAGVGTYLLLRSDSAVTWTPGPAPLGTGLAYRF